MGVLQTVRSGLNVLFTPVLYGVVASLALQLSTWEKGDRTQDKLQETHSADIFAASPDTFDFIIVGGGTAGSVVASRLSEHYSVLLLEAGSDPNPLVYVPGLARSLLRKPEVDWSYETTAQVGACLLSPGKKAAWSGGKGLGGSANLGWMVSLRGHQKDFDNWAKLVEDEGWGYSRMRRYFQRHENFVGNTTDTDAHSQGGEITLQLPDYRPLSHEFMEAGKEMGYLNLDVNGRYNEAFDEIFAPCKKGEKLTSYKMLLEPFRKRDKLTIRKFAKVIKVLLRKSDTSAHGVEYIRHGTKTSVFATHEVILSAGTVGTPQLLLLSGIGPEQHLEEVGVKPLINLPVGRNLQDHLAVPVGPFIIKDPLSFNFDRDLTAQSFFEYGTFGTGPVTTTGYTAQALISSSFAQARAEKDWPDLHLLMHAVSVHSHYGRDMAQAFGLSEDLLKKYYTPAANRHSFHIVVSLARPYARGEVRLDTKDPQSPPIIDPKYLQDPFDFDVKVLVEGVRKAVQVVEGTGIFTGMGGHFTSDALPGCEKSELGSDEYWDCYVRHYSVSMHNPVGTCTMGPVTSPHTVVDNQMRVLNAPGLRVIDASVMPSIVVGGTQETTMAIAEKGAEAVLEFWRELERDGVVTPKFVKHEPVYSSSELYSVKTTKQTPLWSTASPKIATTTVTPIPGFSLSPQTSQSWQNTLDQIAVFSKQIQQSLQATPKVVTPIPPVVQQQTTVTSTGITTVTTTASNPTTNFGGVTVRPQYVFVQTAPPTVSPVTGPLGATYSAPTEVDATAPFVYLPVISVPTEPVKIYNYSLASSPPVVSQFKPSFGIPKNPESTTESPYEILNSTLFLVNSPKTEYQTPVVHPVPPKRPPSMSIYSASSGSDRDVIPKNLVESILLKQHFYHKWSPPKSSRYLLHLSSTSTPPTIIPSTKLELVDGPVLPQEYDNYVDVPLTNVEYYPIATTVAQKHTLPPSSHFNASSERFPFTQRTKSPPFHIIPAVQLTKTPVGTSTTRYIIPRGHQTVSQTKPPDTNDDIEPFTLLDVTTASENSKGVTTTVKPLLSLTHYTSPKSDPSEDIYYMVRKKTKPSPHPYQPFLHEGPKFRHSDRPTTLRSIMKPQNQHLPLKTVEVLRVKSAGSSRHRFPLIAPSSSHYFAPHRLKLQQRAARQHQRIHSSLFSSSSLNSRDSSYSRDSFGSSSTQPISSSGFQQPVLDQMAS